MQETRTDHKHSPPLSNLKLISISDPATLPFELFPDFLIIGPQRTGTTWLYHNLKKHPQIFLPRKKETYYFSTLGRPDHRYREFETLDEFLETHMRDRPRHRLKRHYDCLRYYREWYRPTARGEATATNALLPPEVISELLVIRPNLKAILMLRDPVERAWSHAGKDLARKHQRRPHEIPMEEYARFFRASGQRNLSSFSSLLQTWSQALEPGHLFVGDFKMISRSPHELLTGLQKFLGVRSGPRYFNKHLEERINPSAADSNSQPSDIPERPREYLEDLLSNESTEYQELCQLLNPELLGSAKSDELRNRYGIAPFSCPALPQLWKTPPNRAKSGGKSI